VPGVLTLANQMPPASSPRRSAWRVLAVLNPYAVLGVLIEGTVQTLVEHIPKERQAEVAATLKDLLIDRMRACRIPDPDGNG
jgi:hypothetical protein